MAAGRRRLPACHRIRFGSTGVSTKACGSWLPRSATSSRRNRLKECLPPSRPKSGSSTTTTRFTSVPACSAARVHRESRHRSAGEIARISAASIRRSRWRRRAGRRAGRLEQRERSSACRVHPHLPGYIPRPSYGVQLWRDGLGRAARPLSPLRQRSERRSAIRSGLGGVRDDRSAGMDR